MAQNNIGSLVVLKPGEQHHIAGILTERGNNNIVLKSLHRRPNLVSLSETLHVETDYLRKVIVQDRSSKYTRVGEIMTDQVGAVSLQAFMAILSFDYKN